MGRSAFALSNTTEVCVTFDEIDPDTGLIFEEIFSFSKARALALQRLSANLRLSASPFGRWTAAAGC